MTEFDPNAKVMKPQEYKKDILLYPDLVARVTKRNHFEIDCPISRKKWLYRICDPPKEGGLRDNVDAGKWATGINEAVAILKPS